MEKLISIIMPTFNDSLTITKSFDSILRQSYTNWQLIIVNDGSTDNTKDIIENYIEQNKLKNKVILINQKNSDQLNAIKNGLKYVKGDFVHLFHSDDLLPSDDFYEYCVNQMEFNPNLDSLIGDYLVINDNDQVVDYWKTPNYRKKNRIPAQLIIKLGGNFYGDIGFHRKDVYINKIKNNYLDWNTVFWLNFSENNVEMLNIKKMNRPILKYRINGSNYITNEVGKHNVLTGELRSLTNLMKYYYIPFFKFQKAIYSLFNKRYIRNLKLQPYLPLIYFKQEEKNKSKIIDIAIKKYYKNGYQDNKWLVSLFNFYKLNKDRTIYINNVKDGDVLYGSDLRKFTKLLFAGKLPKIYYDLFDEMNLGFNKIIVKSDLESENLKKILKFICIYNNVNVLVEEEK